MKDDEIHGLQVTLGLRANTKDFISETSLSATWGGGPQGFRESL